jgi:glycosyltransferase involved in cell wall biosynthesis
MEHSQNKSGILSLQFYSYPDEVGGAWKYTHEVNKRLAERGHRVFLVTCKPVDSLPDYEVIDGVHFYRIGVGESKNALGLWRALRRIMNSILDENNISFIHIHNPLVEFLALLNPRFWRIPKIYHFHSLWFEEEKINRCGNGKEFQSLGCLIKLNALLNVIRLIEWACFFSARSVLFLSEYSKAKFKAFFPFQKDRLRVIRGGVDVDVFRPPVEDQALIRQRLGLPAGRPILLTVRRLAARMGLENLVLAMSIVHKRSPHLDFLLIIVGHGVLEEKLKSLVAEHGLQERVRLIGRLDTSVLASYYCSADLFVLPTAFIEGFGMATAEALSSGLPALGTPVGGTIEILKSVNEKWLFRDTTPQAMADLIESFLLDPTPFLALKPLCRETAVLNYSWELVVDGIEEEFQYIATSDK